MAEKKSQHFVPRFYLKNFSQNKNFKTIKIFNIGSNTIIAGAPIRKQACKDYFYGQDHTVENALGQNEMYTSKIINNIINKNILPENPSDDHCTLLTFIILLHARTQYMADEDNEILDKTIKHIFSRDDTMNSMLKKVRVKLTNAPQFSLSTAARFIPLAFDLNYKILNNTTNFGFITSDNPVIYYNQFLNNKNSTVSNTGLAMKGLQIFLPLSPSQLILFFDNEIYCVGKKNDIFVNISNKHDIKKINYLQCINAYKNIYFNESVSDEYINKIFYECLKYRRKDKVLTKELQNRTEYNGRHSSLLQISKNDIDIALHFSSIFLSDYAKQYNIKDKIFHLRDEDYVMAYKEFIKAVDAGLYDIGQFYQFIENEQKEVMLNNFQGELRAMKCKEGRFGRGGIVQMVHDDPPKPA